MATELAESRVKIETGMVMEAEVAAAEPTVEARRSKVPVELEL